MENKNGKIHIKGLRIMRYRIKVGKVGSLTTEKQRGEIKQLEDRKNAEDVKITSLKFLASAIMMNRWRQQSFTTPLPQWNYLPVSSDCSPM